MLLQAAGVHLRAWEVLLAQHLQDAECGLNLTPIMSISVQDAPALLPLPVRSLMAAHEAAQRHGRRNAEEEWDSLCALSLTKTAAAGQGAHVLTVSALRHLLHHALRHVTTIIPDRAALAARPLPIALLRAAHLVASVEAVLEAVHQVVEAVHAVADVKVLHPMIHG